MDQIFQTSEIVLIILICCNIVLQICLHVQTHATDCRGQLITKTKSPDGQTCTREAKLSIHEAASPSELQHLKKNEKNNLVN